MKGVEFGFSLEEERNPASDEAGRKPGNQTGREIRQGM
jgi:hypothetical protein